MLSASKNKVSPVSYSICLWEYHSPYKRTIPFSSLPRLCLTCLESLHFSVYRIAFLLALFAKEPVVIGLQCTSQTLPEQSLCIDLEGDTFPHWNDRHAGKMLSHIKSLYLVHTGLSSFIFNSTTVFGPRAEMEPALCAVEQSLWDSPHTFYALTTCLRL